MKSVSSISLYIPFSDLNSTGQVQSGVRCLNSRKQIKRKQGMCNVLSKLSKFHEIETNNQCMIRNVEVMNDVRRPGVMKALSRQLHWPKFLLAKIFFHQYN